MASSPVSVFVRVRPLTPAEDGADLLPGLALESSDPAESGPAVALDTSTPIGGFTGVLGTGASNRDVFDRCFVGHVASVVRGGFASLFCYGYTGAGKTHTVIGYGGDRGLYFLAAEQLLRELRAQQEGCADGQGKMFLRATAVEVYNDDVFDLLGPERVECTLRVDESGQLVVQGPAESTWLDRSEWGYPEGVAMEKKDLDHSAKVCRTQSLRSVFVHEPEDLQRIQETCVQKRAVGSSTEHHQSSRSHAMLRLEVVSEATLKAEAAVEEASVTMPARRTALDNSSTADLKLLYEAHKQYFAPVPANISLKPSMSDMDEINFDLDSMWEIDGNNSEGMFKLKGMEEMKTVPDWAAHFGVPQLHLTYVLPRRKVDWPGGWEALRDEVKATQKRMRQLVDETQKNIDEAAAALAEVRAGSPASVGGTMVLVDLAGADYDHRSGTQQKESAAINKSLLALKECFRSLTGASPQRPNFRASKLTRMLEDTLAPSASSARRNKASVSVMLVNASPAAHLERMTLNGLRYGQMYAGGGSASAAAARGGAAGAKATAKAKIGARARPPQEAKPCDPEVREELLKIYAEKCPEKSEADVADIFAKFAGRERELLDKVREKYLGQS